MGGLTLHWVWVGIKKLPAEYLTNIRNIMEAAILTGGHYKFDVKFKIWTDDTRLIVSTLAKEDCLFLLNFIDVCSIHPLFADHKNDKMLELVRLEMTGSFANYASASDIIRLLILKEQTSGWHLYFDTDTSHVCLRDQGNHMLFCNTLQELNESTEIYTCISGDHGGNDILMVNASDAGVIKLLEKYLNNIADCYGPNSQEFWLRHLVSIYGRHQYPDIDSLITRKRFASRKSLLKDGNSRRYLTINLTGPGQLINTLVDPENCFAKKLNVGWISTFFATKRFTNHRGQPAIGMSVASGCGNTWLVECPHQKPSDDSTLPRTLKSYCNPQPFYGCFFSSEKPCGDSVKREIRLNSLDAMAPGHRLNQLAKHV